MSEKPQSSKLNTVEFARQISGQLVPLRNRFSYFFTGVPFADDDVKEYLDEPVLALPPAIREKLPETAILLVPYLEHSNGEDRVAFERPAPKVRVWDSVGLTPELAALIFAVKDQEVAEYHYRFYHCLAKVLVEAAGESIQDAFFAIVQDELSGAVHGEVDEESWELKQALLRRQTNLRRKTKGFDKYARQALIDTLTLYLHGICCDIDVETGPRQLASRYLRRRLELLQELFPPPDGYAVFPEDLKSMEAQPRQGHAKDQASPGGAE